MLSGACVELFRGYLTTELGFAVDQPTDLTLPSWR